MVHSAALADRVREALAGHPSRREVKMFGGLAFMVNDRMIVSVGRDGDLLVRVDPRRSAELLAIKGARQAEMGAGRTMGDGWISVDSDATSADDDLKFWLDVALEYTLGS